VLFLNTKRVNDGIAMVTTVLPCQAAADGVVEAITVPGAFQREPEGGKRNLLMGSFSSWHGKRVKGEKDLPTNVLYRCLKMDSLTGNDGFPSYWLPGCCLCFSSTLVKESVGAAHARLSFNASDSLAEGF